MVEPLAVVVRHLERALIPFMLTGSLASSVHGEPRSTQDIDLVIDPDPESLERFLAGLDRDRFYVSDSGARRALGQRDMFNVIDMTTSWKFDLVVRKERPYSRVEFDRREVTEVLGLRLALASAEDVVLAKLEWGLASRSERQMRDVVGILAANPRLDRDYLATWAAELGVTERLQEAEDAVGR